MIGRASNYHHTKVGARCTAMRPGPFVVRSRAALAADAFYAKQAAKFRSKKEASEMSHGAMRTALLLGTAGCLATSLLSSGIAATVAASAATTARSFAAPVPQGYSWLYNYHSGKCVYVPGASAQVGAHLVQGTCKNRREFGFSPRTGFSGSEYFIVESVNLPSRQHRFLCVSVSSLRNGSAVVQEKCNFQNPPAKQRVVFHHGGFVHGYTWSVAQSVYSLLCLNIAGASKANGAALVQTRCISVRHHSDWFIFVKPGTHLPCPCRSAKAALAALRRSTA